MLMRAACSLSPPRQISSTQPSFRSCYLFKGWHPLYGKEIYPATILCKKMQTTTVDIVHGSYKSVGKAKRVEPRKGDSGSKKSVPVGAFQKLPMVQPPTIIIASALKKNRKVLTAAGMANAAKSERKKGAMKLDALMKDLAVTLRTYQETFPKIKHLHIYEQSLVELSLGSGVYGQALGRLDALRKRVVSVGKEYASLCTKSKKKQEAVERFNEGIKTIKELFEGDENVLLDLVGIAKNLRPMPVLDLASPTLSLIGAPNVGKSSLVRIISTGKPEVCNYPFTTRGVLMGHIFSDYQYFQVTDTPGLLKRNDEDRNNMERLTLAVLSHLPTAVMYVHDLSGHCGMSPSDQFKIYKGIRERFSDHLWLDVVSKCDLLEDSIFDCISEDGYDEHTELERYLKVGPAGALHVSVTSEVGLSELDAKSTLNQCSIAFNLLTILRSPLTVIFP